VRPVGLEVVEGKEDINEAVKEAAHDHSGRRRNAKNANGLYIYLKKILS
jgi:hypothetical protein